MATTISTQDLENARRDIDDIGKAVNENLIVDPRYGADFKSLPMIAAEGQAIIDSFDSAAQGKIDEWQDAINTIVVNDGVPALAISDASGETQQAVNLKGAAIWYARPGGYSTGDTVRLANGDIVKSTISGNTLDPNVDMTGWVRVDDSSQIFDSESGLDQKALNSIFKSTKYMDVRYFGIYPGLSNDIGVLINTADAAARSLGCGLYFPTGTYLATGILPTVSWTGDGKGKTIIKNHGTNVNTGFCVIRNSMVFKIYDGITFDGSVSADPVAWDSTNYDSFTGSISLFIENSSKVILSNIECKNAAKMSNLRITGSYDVFLFDVDTEKARGNFGDGIYIAVNSRRIFGDRVNIKDVTRIGLVFEGGTRDCVFNNVTVDYAHDCSRQYGGGEYNGGVWAENATGIYINDSSTNDTRDHGFLCTTGATLTGYAKAHFELRNCTADNVSIGFMNRSKQDSIPASHKLFNCKSSAYTPFMFVARYEDDSYESYNCDSTIKGSTTTMTAIYAALYLQREGTYIAKRNRVVVRDFSIVREVPLTKFTDAAVYDSDITFYEGHYFDVKLDNVRTLDNSPVYIKNRLLSATNDKTVIANSKVNFPVFRTTDLKAHACELSGSINNSTGKSRFYQTDVKSKLSLSSYDFRFSDLDCDFALAADFLEILSANDTLDLVGKINNAKFKKDISTGDYSLKFQSGNNANKAKLLVANSEFYSSSSATTATNTHVWIVRSPSSVIYQNVLRDSFANMQKVNTTVATSDPAGVTALTLH